MNRKLHLLALYLVAGVLMSAYGASVFLAGTAQVVASSMRHHASQTAEVSP